MLALCWSVVFLAAGALCDVGPIVTTLGRVAGWERLSRDGRVYQAWTSLPYAEPPVGKLRFKAPKPAQKWSGVLNATKDAPMCLQKNPVITGSEDCLYLSVYRPKNGTEKMPVLFRIHGGGFQIGSMGTRENADYLMDEDVVLVQVHYRLNAFGFMGLGDKVMPGNFGLKDLVMALKWVQKNIAAFGGDPNSVTVLGESSGGASAHVLLKTPAAEGLVHRALSDSGTFNNLWSELSVAVVRNGTLGLAAEVGCDIKSNSQVIFKCLQEVSSQNLMSVFPDAMTGIANFAPCIEPKDAEDAVITEDLSILPSKKPWIISNCDGEFLLTAAELLPKDIANVQKHLGSHLQHYISELVNVSDPAGMRAYAAILEKAYFPLKEPLDVFTFKFAKMVADCMFFFPELYNLLHHEGPKWYYYFEYVGELTKLDIASYYLPHGPNVSVAAHADQRLFYFNFRSQYPNVSPRETPEDYHVSKRMIKYLVNFAYYGDPTPTGSSSKWEQFGGHQILRIANSHSDFIGDECFYQSLLCVLNVWTYVIGWGPSIRPITKVILDAHK